MKKVLIIANSSGGLYSFRTDLIKKLMENYEVVAAAPFGAQVRVDRLRDMGLRLIETNMEKRGMNPLKEFSLYREYKKLIKAEKPDFIITYTVKPNIYGGLAAHFMRVPFAANITGLGSSFEKKGLLKTFVTKLYRMSLKHAKVVFFENAADRQTFVNEKIIGTEKTCVLSGAGVNMEKYYYQAYPKDDKPFRFLFVGRIMKEKGMDELMAAAKKLYDEGADCVLDVVGELKSSYSGDYEARMAEAEKQGWLRFYGYRDDVRPYIGAAHCFVLPSWHEGMANTNLENASSGRPVITSDIPGCREAVIEGKTGFTCKAKDAGSLYAAMKRMMSLSNAERDEMGKAAREHMAATFDKIQVVKTTVEKLDIG